MYFQVLLPDGRPIPTVLVGNKCDQPAAPACADAARLEQAARDGGFRGWFASSARDDINVEAAARRLVEAVFEDRERMGELKSPSSAHGGPTRGREDAGDGPRILVLEEDEEGGGRRKKCNC